MDNAAIAAAFDELAERLTLVEKSPYRLLAYRRAASAIRQAPVAVASMAAEGRAREIDGVGDAIAEKIDDLLATGSFRALDRAREQVPDGLLELTRVEGVGTKTAIKIWNELDAETFADVTGAAHAGRLAAIPGVGAKTAGAVLVHADALEQAAEDPESAGGTWLLRDEAEAVLLALDAMVREAAPSIIAVDVGGEWARGVEYVDRLDLLLTTRQPVATLTKVVDHVTGRGWSAPDADASDHDVLLRAANGAMVRLLACAPADRADCFLDVVGPPAYVEAVRAADGPARGVGDHPADELPDGPLHAARGLAAVALELRDVPGVLDDPHLNPADLVREQDLVAELHCHSDWSDGRRPIRDMVEGAIRQGNRIIAITDHSAPYAMVNGLDDARLQAQRDEIDRLNEEFAGQITILQGSEVEVQPDGSLGLGDHILTRLDWVVASIHVSQRQEADKINARIARVLANPLVDCIGHPTSRLIGRRKPTALDVDRMIELALERGTILEINASANRLDLNAEHARAALAAGCRLTVNTDAHGPNTLHIRSYGVSTARRAGARVGDVVNCIGDVDALMALRPRNRA